MKIKLPLLLIKVFHFEYWPFSVFYIPMYIYGIYLGFKAQSATYFTATNPRMFTGGAIGQPKNELFNDIDKKYLPYTLYFDKYTSGKKILESLQKAQINFPVVLKPNIGERGMNVEKINNQKELFDYVDANTFDLIVQEFINYPLEFGILYYRFPGENKGHISSVVHREFLVATGDGKSTLAELVESYDRARFQKERIKKKFAHIWHKPLSENEKLLLEPIGNHNRGTKFLNANYLINEKLVVIFDHISKSIPQYYYGRFDLRVPSLEDLYAGKNIRIMELNGVNSEPAHIYDPKTPILTAYRVVFQHMTIIYKIGVQNHRAGVAYLPFKAMLKELYIHFFQRKRQARIYY